MAFDPSLFAGGGLDPSQFAPFDDDTPDPDEQESVRLLRNEIAAKSGYPSWNAYVRAVGEIKGLQQQETALQIQKLQAEIARGGAVSPSSAAQLVQSAQQFSQRLEQDRAELAQRQAQQQAALVEQQRQFGETFGANKAEFNIQQTERERAARAGEEESRRRFDIGLGESEKDRAARRGETLLGLGSRPDTLIRYLFALRGQQAPQGLGEAPALPGSSSVGQAASGAASPSSPARSAAISPIVEGPPTTAAPASLGAIPPASGASYAGASTDGRTIRWAMPDGSIRYTNAGGTADLAATQRGILPPQQNAGITLTGPGANGMFAPGQILPGSPQSFVAPPLPATGTALTARSGGSFSGVPTSLAQNPNPGQSFYVPGLSPEPPVADRQRQISLSDRQADIDEARRNRYDRGGVIPEPVMGTGLMSGQSYTFGEKGTEVVVPKDKVPHDIFEDLMRDAREVDYSEDKSGKRRVKVTRSYANGGTIGYDPQAGFAPPSLFNPPKVRNEFGFPQIPHFTGGTSLVPSAQRLFQALPSERNLFAGYLRDEVGAQPDDVFELARRLAPQGSPRAGRFVN